VETKKTNNSFLSEKVALRLRNIPDQKRVKVLDAYAGEGIIWNAIQYQRKDIDFEVTSIDIKDYGLKGCLKGDNLKIMGNMSLDNFDIIDLDAYGVPSEQIDLVFRKQFKGIVFATFIQTSLGKFKKRVLREYGFSDEMIKTCPVLLSSKRNEAKIIKHYIASKGVRSIQYYRFNRKWYIAFDTREA